MSLKVCVPLADGFEEIEAVTIIDVLRRAEIEVIISGVGSTDKGHITGAHGLKVMPDEDIKGINSDTLDGIVLPGGMPGAKNLSQSQKVCSLIDVLSKKKKLVAAICASPAVVLAPLGALDGKKAVCYPGFEKGFKNTTQATDLNTAEDENVITSKGPGTAMDFALKIVAKLCGSNVAGNLAGQMQVS